MSDRETHALLLLKQAENSRRNMVQYLAAGEAYAATADRVKQQAEAYEQGARALTASCGTCGNWLPWARRTARHPADSMRGDCQHPTLRGKISGFDHTFGCVIWRPVEESDRRQGRGAIGT